MEDKREVVTNLDQGALIAVDRDAGNLRAIERQDVDPLNLETTFELQLEDRPPPVRRKNGDNLGWMGGHRAVEGVTDRAGKKVLVRSIVANEHGTVVARCHEQASGEDDGGKATAHWAASLPEWSSQRAGTLSVNAYSEGDITTPFGGFKESGFGGRDKGLEAFDQYTEKKTVWISVKP